MTCALLRPQYLPSAALRSAVVRRVALAWLLLALVVVPTLGRLHQVVHGAALDQAHAHNDKDTQEDIARHRAMAAAHEAAAKCLESGKGHDQCQKDLQAACRILAIGKYCGMKHAH